MSAKRSILVVDDDPSTREILRERLGDDHGFAVRTAESLDAAEKAINDEQCCFDAVILDLGMPDGNGCDYCTQLRRQGHNMPVIMLTGLRGEDDVVRGLIQVPTIISPSPFVSVNCLRGSGLSCVNSSGAKMRRFRSGLTFSDHRRSCCTTQPLNDTFRSPPRRRHY